MAVALPTQATQTNFGDIVQRGVANVQAAEDRAFRREELERQRALEFQDRYGIPEELFQLEDTQFRTLNDVTTESLSMARDEYYKTYKELQADPTNIDLKKKLGKIRNTVTVLGKNHESMKALGEKYVTMLAEDKVSGVYEDDMRQILEGYDKGNVKTRYDEDGNFQYLFYDENGRLKDVKNYTEVAQLDFNQKIDVDEQLKTLMENVGSDEVVQREGGYLVTKNVFGERQRGAVAEYIDGQLGTDQESLKDNPVLSDLLYQATGGSISKKENFTEEERQLVKNWMMDKAYGRYSQETRMQADPFALNAQRGSLRGSGDDQRRGAALIELSETTDNKPQIEDGKVIYTLGKPSSISATKSDRRVNRIRYNPETNAIELEAEDRIKLKGEQEANSIKKKEPETIIEKLTAPDGTTTYYKVDPYVISSDNSNGMKEINTFANYNELGSVTRLIDVLRQKYTDKYGSIDNLEIPQEEGVQVQQFNGDLGFGQNTPTQGEIGDLPE